MKMVVVMLAALVTACSSMSFNTNIGPYAESRIKSTAVEEYSPIQISKYNTTTLGFVEASYCQKHIDQPNPNKRALVNDLKVKTHDLGGNGVVVEACAIRPSGACNQYMECRGVAYSVPQRQSRP